MRTLYRILLPLLFTLSLAGCQKKIQPEEQPAPEEKDTFEATITLNASTLILAAEEGASGAFVFSCDHQWTLEIPEDAQAWLSASKTSGKATKTTSITFTAKANDGARRTATCRILSGASKKKFTVAQDMAVLIINASDVPDIDKYYKPAEFNYDMLRSDVQWSWCRSAQSEHFFLFWEKEYGAYGLYGAKAGTEDTSPKTLPSSDAMYVDIDDLLEKAEEFYRVNIDVLKFADTGKGKSNLDKYKMQIYLHHTTTWMAYGGGYDDVIGGLWINPATCHPVGSTIAHEIGHSFQYQVYADAIAGGAPRDYSTGWRYEIGQGCGFWEQCAQWQSYQSYAEQAFTTVNFTEFVNNCHRHFTHEHQRYASYFLMWHWASRFGVAEIGELWRLSKKPEDPIQTYQRKHGLSMEALNADLYDYAARCVTWDFDAEATNLYEGKLTGVTQPVREFGRNYIGKIGWAANFDQESGFYTVDYSRAPEATGFNHIRLNVHAGGTVEVRFEGMPNAAGFNRVADPSIAGWNAGFVALMPDGRRVYSESTRVRDAADISWEVPAGASKLWMVVAATPETYLQHLWDEDNTNDEQWPFRVRFTGTDLFGNLNFDGTETPYDITIDHEISTSAAAGYGGTSLTLDDDVIEIARAFVMQPSEIVAALGEFNTVRTAKVKLLAVKPDGSLDTSYQTTDPDSYYSANGFGFWFGADGSIQPWGSAYVFMEFDPGSWTCQFGVHPNRVSSGELKAGDHYPVRFAFVSGGHTARINFTVNITD